MSTNWDVAIVGAGISGASLAAELAPHASVLLLEMEDRPGYHSTGRSVAFWAQTHGGSGTRQLTAASHAFLSGGGFLKSRQGLYIADEGGRDALQALGGDFSGSDVLQWIDRPEMEHLVPGLRPAWRWGLLESNCGEIDVAALHASCLAAARKAGARLLTGSEARECRR